MAGGLLIGGRTIEFKEQTDKTTAAATATLAGLGITPVTKTLTGGLDVVGLLTGLNPAGKFFSHDKIEGVAAQNGGTTLTLSNDSDFGIDSATGTGPYALVPKIIATGAQDDGELLQVDLTKLPAQITTATVTVSVAPTPVLPEFPLPSLLVVTAALGMGGLVVLRRWRPTR